MSTAWNCLEPCLPSREQYVGFIHPSERYAEPRLGEVVNARVIGFREVDRTLNYLWSHAPLRCWKTMPKWFWPIWKPMVALWTLNDKSLSEEIKATFGISKASSKKALGGLMKAKKSSKTSLEQVDLRGGLWNRFILGWWRSAILKAMLLGHLADLAFHESAFPKHTDDFDEVSRF